MGWQEKSEAQEHLEGNNQMASYCLFAVLYVAGIRGVYYGQGQPHTQRSSLFDDPPIQGQASLGLCLFTLIKYPLPFILCSILCSTIWSCLERLISLLKTLFGFREEENHPTRTTELINSLPIYKFKVNKSENNNDIENNIFGVEADADDGGGIILSQGSTSTEEGREVSGEDAVCCICLVKYANNDKLKELPCSHFFHKQCIDKWLKINASCPLCKAQLLIGLTIVQPLSEPTANPTLT